MIGRVLERLSHGLLAGGLVGLLVGLIEYWLLLRGQAFAGDPIKGYWDILVPHVLGGLIAGVVAAVAIGASLARGAAPGAFAARLWAAVVALAVLAYFVAGVTLWAGPPILKLSSLVGYLISVVIAGAIFLGVERGLRRGIARCVDGRSSWLARARIPLALAGLGIALLALTPSLIGARKASALPAGNWAATMSQSPRPNIVFIMIDTVRADHLPMYGYNRPTAPHLSALARESALLTQMYAQAPSTRPSVATLFSSLYPVVHKVHDNQDYLSDSAVVLAEVLRDAGYRTFAISANANVSPTFGYAQGFDTFRVWKTESAVRLTTAGQLAESALGPTRLAYLLREHREIVPRADAITDLTLDWVAGNPNGPLFLYVHYIDPHYPYRAPEPWNRRFDARREPPRRAGDVDPLTLVSGGPHPDHVAQILDQYDGEILFTDHHVGRLLDGLRARGVLQDAIVVVTSDHGEEFYEHRQIGHGKSLYDEVLHVPFMVHWPGHIGPATHEQPRGLIDVTPTLLALLKIEKRPEMQGISFAGDLTGSPDSRSGRKFFAQVVTDHFSMEMVREPRYKLVRHLRGPRTGEEEFYDLARDPLERTNLGRQPPREALALREELALFNTFARQSAPLIQARRVKTLDGETERALRSLGYIK